MKNCVICAGSSACFSCIIQKQQIEIDRLSSALKYYQKETPLNQLKNKNYHTRFETNSTFLPLPILGQIKDYYFLTITFDPQKFGLANDITLEQNYIFYTLYRLIKKQFTDHLTGSFEYQKNGATHAHLILKINDKSPKELIDFIQPYYTDDKKNKYAIKLLPAKFPNVIDYIKKESSEYYRFTNISALDFDLYPEPEPLLEVQQETPVDRRLILYEKLIESHQKEIADWARKIEIIKNKGKQDASRA